jgi:hypothetical protein
MQPIWRERYQGIDNPMLDVDSQEHVRSTTTDYRCFPCQLVIEVNGGSVTCGTCGLGDCGHIENIGLSSINPDADIPSELDFYFHGKRHMYGRIGDRDYEVEIATGKIKRITSPAYRRKVFDNARIVGAAAAARKSGLPAATIRSWLSRGEPS